MPKKECTDRRHALECQAGPQEYGMIPSRCAEQVHKTKQRQKITNRYTAQAQYKANSKATRLNHLHDLFVLHAICPLAWVRLDVATLAAHLAVLAASLVLRAALVVASKRCGIRLETRALLRR